MSRFQTAVLSVLYNHYSTPFYFDAYGGEKKVINKNLIVHEFSGSDTFSIFPYPNQRDGFFANVNILLVGGGGGGGQFGGGGGGGAGEVYQASYKFPTGSYQIVIGSGGDVGIDGTNTEISPVQIKALGGGAGGSAFLDDARRGASGGGAGGRSNAFGAEGIRGNKGGASFGNIGGGGGGGAGENGKAAGIL